MAVRVCVACHGAEVDPAASSCRSCGAPLPAAWGAVAVAEQPRIVASPGFETIQRRCGWCEAYTSDLYLSHCRGCGGPLPSLPARILWELSLPSPPIPRPPESPRWLPRGYEMRAKLWKNPMVLIGVVFTVVFCWSILFPLVGIPMWVVGSRRARQKLDALVRGRPAEGTITRVWEDTSVHINNQHPWSIDYAFETPAGTCSGTTQSWDHLSRLRQAGERVWVVYTPENPAQNCLWPPVY